VSFLVSIKPVGYDVLICEGASNWFSAQGTQAALASGYTAWSSGALYSAVDLSAENGGVKFACKKIAPATLVAPITQSWTSLKAIGTRSSDSAVLHGPEISLGRYLQDRGRRVAILMYSEGGTGLAADWLGATGTAANAFYLQQLALLDAPYVVRACIRSVGSVDANDATNAANFSANSITRDASIRTAIGARAAGMTGVLLEMADDIAAEHAHGSTVQAQGIVYRNGTTRFLVPTNVSDGDTNDIGFDTTELTTGADEHYETPEQVESGRRMGACVYRHCLPIYSPNGTAIATT
jgi:hypothetical protein